MHAIFQFTNDSSLFVYDISIHRTLLNKKQIPTKKYVELKHGDVIKFGHSSRNYVLCIEEKSKEQNKENNQAQNGNENEKMLQMQEKIKQLEKDLNCAQNAAAVKAKQVDDLMQKM